MANNLFSQRLLLTGTICAQWAFVEYLFAMSIWRLLSLDEATGKIVTGGLDMLPRANMAINLARHSGGSKDLQEALLEARKAIQAGLDTRRNRAVHGVGFTRDGDETVMVEVHRGKGGRDKQPLPNEELSNLSTEIHAVGDALCRALEASGVVCAAGVFIPPAIARKTPARTSPRLSQPES